MEKNNKKEVEDTRKRGDVNSVRSLRGQKWRS